MANKELAELQKMEVLKLDEDSGEFISNGFKVPYPTPWGPAARAYTYRRGVHFITTESHGGFLVARRFAENNLTDAARQRAIEFNNYYCFEQENAAALVMYELPELRRVSEEELMVSLQRYNAQYLVERGTVLTEETNHVAAGA